MKGPFGMLLLGGGIILIYGLFTGKISFGGSGSSTQPTSPTLIPGVPGTTAALPGTKCPPGTSNVAGSCRADPHKCGAGSVWFQGKCVPIVT